MAERGVVIVGGGPAGAAAARLLASWGHSVTLLDKAGDEARGLAESIPPSTHKLLEQIGIADAIERAGFLRTRGNTVWWASRERRVETFGEDSAALGYQVFRPHFDRVLLTAAGDAGADVRTGAAVRQVALGSGSGATPEADVVVDQNGATTRLRAKFVLDCSGRAGVIGRRFRAIEPGHRTCALVGVWRRAEERCDWGLPDETHTVVETFADGWAWSVPTSTATRHVGAMVGQAYGDESGERTLAALISNALAKTIEVGRLVDGATLEHVWACDASLYSSTAYAGPNHLLVGDAGSFIDPLSSFGVKKALASAWVGAIVATHTALSHPERDSRGARVLLGVGADASTRRISGGRASSRVAAARRHPHAFWDWPRGGRAAGGRRHRGRDVSRDPAVRRAFEPFAPRRSIDLALADDAASSRAGHSRPRDCAGAGASPAACDSSANVDLVTLAEIAPLHRARAGSVRCVLSRTVRRCRCRVSSAGCRCWSPEGILHERA